MTETQDVVQKAPRTEPAKSTLPQHGRPVPSRAYPGALIVVEGTDGSGKSTQLYLLKRWLEIGGYRLHFTEWNSSPLVKSATRRGKQRRLLTPTTFSLLLAAESIPVCAGSGHYFLRASAAGRGGPSHPERASEAEILRSRHGFGNVVRPGGKLPAVPGANSGRVRQDGGLRQFRGARWNAARE